MDGKIEININDYLSKEEIKELCIEYVKDTLKGNKHHEERILNNLGYHASYAILDSVLTQEMMEIVRKRVLKQITDCDFGIFRKKDAWGSEDSEAYLEVKKAVAEHKHLISGLVKDCILKKDYEAEINENGSYLVDFLIEALKTGLSK